MAKGTLLPKTMKEWGYNDSSVAPVWLQWTIKGENRVWARWERRNIKVRLEEAELDFHIMKEKKCKTFGHITNIM